MSTILYLFFYFFIVRKSIPDKDLHRAAPALFADCIYIMDANSLGDTLGLGLFR